MTLNEEQLEWIVREVIRRLSGAAPVDAGSLRLEARVVSLATIEKRLDGVTKVIVRRRAVVTPSAKDLLRERKIELARATE